MKQVLFVILLTLVTATLSCIEVGGHISQDTIWSPENNPYIITSYLYINDGVTLTIMPGTQIRCSGANKSSLYNFMWTGNNQPISKMIIVFGTINAIGTSELPITFDKYQEDVNYRWGGIYIAPNARISTFEYCEFRNVFFCDYAPGDWSLAAIEFHNGMINVRSCTFENNLNAIRTGFLQSDILLYDCKFISENDTYPTPFGITGFLGFSAAPEPVPDDYYKVTIAKCYFTGNAGLGPVGYYMEILYLNNVLENFISRDDETTERLEDFGSVSSYGNYIFSGRNGIGCYSSTVNDTVFARRNKLIKPSNINPVNTPLILGSEGFGTNFVADNYLSGCVQVTAKQSNATTSYIYNNIIDHNYGNAVIFENLNPTYQGGQTRFFNNLLRYTGDSTFSLIVKVNLTSPFLYNNTFVDFRSLLRTIGDSDMIFENNIIPCTQWSPGSIMYDHHPVLVNNCLAMPILPPWEMLEGGGNFVADPMYTDTLNADYSLSMGSPCIDAGAYRPDLPEFDIRYHKRFASGTEGGMQTVDVGAYEYNSVYIGGLRGIVFNPDNGEMIDCARIEISQKLPEFSDSLGCFEYPTGSGVYTIRASRWDYQDQIIENVVVTEGEITPVAIPMYLVNTASDAPDVSPVVSKSLFNYPNPFNPETTISFVSTRSGRIRLKIYNLKGQLIKTLMDGAMPGGYHSIKWNGTDDNHSSVSSGVYFARIEINGETQVRKMMLLK